MQDPSSRIAPQLLRHLHLLSSIKYPHTPLQLTPENVLSHLLQAPRIVREAQPVSWQFLTPPPNGTVFLSWQPTAQRGTTFASDGYVWAEPEQSYTNEIGGYLIESFVHETGFVPGKESLSTHRRTRARIIRGPANAQFDPQLEIVQWTQARPEHHIPASSIRTSSSQSKLQVERQELMRQGGLRTKQFMYPDAQNWPYVNGPQAAPPVQGNPYQPANMMGRPGMHPMGPQPVAPQPFYNIQQGPRGAAPGPSPHKRARTGTVTQPGASYRASAAGLDEAVINGDDRLVDELLDLLTPREISLTRYKQHAEWMAEVLSAYDVREILPMALGLGLTGELADLTKGIIDRDQSWEKEEEAVFTDITSEQKAELEKRVAEFKQKGHEQLAEMRRAHAEKMEEMSQQKAYARLERQLAEVGQKERAKIDELEEEAQQVSSLKLQTDGEIVRISKGGLLARGEEAPRDPERAHIDSNDGNGSDDNGNQQMSEQNDMFSDFANLDNTAGAELDFYSNDYAGMSYS